MIHGRKAAKERITQILKKFDQHKLPNVVLLRLTRNGPLFFSNGEVVQDELDTIIDKLEAHGSVAIIEPKVKYITKENTLKERNDL